MRRSCAILFVAMLWLGTACFIRPAFSQDPGAEADMPAADKQKCIAHFGLKPDASDSKNFKIPKPGTCKVVIRNGHRFPDPKCTPGALNPTVTEKVLRDPEFTTACIRNMATSEDAKKQVFAFYGLAEDDTCEMDHFVSLEIGGADTLDNIWPQCGPPGSQGEARDFRQKDKIEGFLGTQVRNRVITQQAAKQRIIRDWSKAGPPQ